MDRISLPQAKFNFPHHAHVAGKIPLPSAHMWQAKFVCLLCPCPHALVVGKICMPSMSLPSCSGGRQNPHTFYFSALMLRWQAKSPCLLFPYPHALVAGIIHMPSISIPSCSGGRQNSHALYFPVLIFQQTDPLYTLPSLNLR